MVTRVLHDKSIRIPVTPDELQMAQEVAEAQGTTVAALLRAFIRQQHAAMSAPTKRKPAKRSR